MATIVERTAGMQTALPDVNRNARTLGVTSLTVVYERFSPWFLKLWVATSSKEGRRLIEDYSK
jgi:hypothetical protein